MAVYKPTYTDKKTGETKQAGVWWYEFTYAGRRVRESAKTTRKTIAVNTEKQRRLELERALAGMPSEQPRDRIRSVKAVVDLYEKAYKVNHRKKSFAVVAERSVHVRRLLGNLLIPDITQERAITYMEARQKEGASNRTINMELEVLSRAMGQTWRLLWPKVKKLEENQDAGQALESEQEKAILEAAARNDSPLIFPYLMSLGWTGMRCDETRMLQWFQVDFDENHVVVGKAKSEKGTGRVIPMSGALRAALEHHASWYASKLGPIQPDWYVFPRMISRRPVDATQPMTSLSSAWSSVRKDAGVRCRLHDFRHTFCTKLGEAGVPEQTMLDMMGHVSAAMLRRYSHIRAKARREAIDALEARANSTEALQESPKVSGKQPKRKIVTH